MRSSSLNQRAVIGDARARARRTRRQVELAAGWLRDLRDTPARFTHPSPAGPDLPRRVTPPRRSATAGE